jgi:hypothetical protein
MPEPLSHPRTDTEVELGNQKIMDDIYQSWRAALLLAEADKTDETDEDSDDEEMPLPSSKRFTFKVTEFPSLPDDSYITLRLNDRYNGKIIKRKIISTRDPHWNQKSFSFDVRNAGAATITCKMKVLVKRKARLLGVMMKKSTERRRETKLVNNGNRIEQLLANFKVAVVRIKDIEPFDVEKKKREERKLKERLAFCEQNGIDPYVRMGSDETYGLGQQQKEKKIPEIKTKKKPNFWVKYGFLYPDDRYTRRRFEY